MNSFTVLFIIHSFTVVVVFSLQVQQIKSFAFRYKDLCVIRAVLTVPSVLYIAPADFGRSSCFSYVCKSRPCF